MYYGKSAGSYMIIFFRTKELVENKVFFKKKLSFLWKKHLGRFFLNLAKKSNLKKQTCNCQQGILTVILQVSRSLFLSPKKVIEPKFPKKGYPPGAKRPLAHIFHSIDYQGHWRTALKLHKVVLHVTCKLLVLFFKTNLFLEAKNFEWRANFPVKKIWLFCVIELEKQQKTIYKGPDRFWHLLC